MHDTQNGVVVSVSFSFFFTFLACTTTRLLTFVVYLQSGKWAFGDGFKLDKDPEDMKK